jgi:hypothetical protein
MTNDVNLNDNYPAIACAMPPVIIDNLVNIQQNLQALMLDVSELPRNDESLKYVKQVRANLSKELEKMESQRKAAKKKALEPYERAEAKYKEYISTPYKEADAKLKEWVDSYQNELKDYCLNILREYFDELCQTHSIDFITFEQMGIVVDMAMARQAEPRKAMEKIYNRIESIRSDMDLILKLDDAEEIMAEYRKTVDLSVAMSVVTLRRQEKNAMANYIAEQKQQLEQKEKHKAMIYAAAPDLGEEEERFTVTFRATGSFASLKAMKSYGATLGIEFEEIKEDTNDE